jgi:arylformamidase
MADKARLFTRAGYLFASINYRLSPDPPTLDRPRTRFPAHPRDVGEALAWLHKRAARFGGDGDRIVVAGHSAGAHIASLVATDPRYVERLGAPVPMMRGLVSLDGAAFDVPRAIRLAAGSFRLLMLENAFGTRAEQRRDPRWARASPLAHAGHEDPPTLVVQQDRPSSLAVARPFERALGPDARLLPVDKSHEEINRHLGSPADRTRMTSRVLAFVNSVLRRGE